MRVQLDVEKAVPAAEPILRNLAELYAYDFSEVTRRDLNEQGRFDHDFFRDCWSGEARVPYLFRVDGKLAGFAVVARGSRITDDRSVIDVAEFFVIRRYRRQGIGIRAAAALFDLHPGTWEVRELLDNVPARAFWRKAIGLYTNGRFEEVTVNDERWRGWVQRFCA